jgi:hypothetical protein
VPQQKETIMSKPDEKLNQISGALDDKDLQMVTGGDKKVTWAHDDESPKETVTFEYGGLAIQYSQQKPS